MAKYLTQREKNELKRYAGMSAYDYMLEHYAKHDIHIEDEYCDYEKNIHNLTPEQLWFNNVSLKYPSPCRKCETDLKNYNKLYTSGNKKLMNQFDDKDYKGRLCTQKWCMWFGYFVSRRLGFFS